MSRSFLTFNIHDGGQEATVHGYKNGILRTEEYSNLAQCDTPRGEGGAHRLDIVHTHSHKSDTHFPPLSLPSPEPPSRGRILIVLRILISSPANLTNRSFFTLAFIVPTPFKLVWETKRFPGNAHFYFFVKHKNTHAYSVFGCVFLKLKNNKNASLNPASSLRTAQRQHREATARSEQCDTTNLPPGPLSHKSSTATPEQK